MSGREICGVNESFGGHRCSLLHYAAYCCCCFYCAPPQSKHNRDGRTGRQNAGRGRKSEERERGGLSLFISGSFFPSHKTSTLGRKPVEGSRLVQRPVRSRESLQSSSLCHLYVATVGGPCGGPGCLQTWPGAAPGHMGHLRGGDEVFRRVVPARSTSSCVSPGFVLLATSCFSSSCYGGFPPRRNSSAGAAGQTSTFCHQKRES